MTYMTYMTSKVLEEKASKITVVLTIKVIGALFATLVFARFTPLIDANLYLSGYYDSSSGLRTMIVQTLAVFVNGFGGAFLTHVFFGVVSAAGILYYVVIGGKHWLMLLVLLFPSSLVWTSIVGKEALFFGGFTLLLVIWSRFVIGPLNRIDLFTALLALGLCGLLRPHYAAVILWLFFSTGIIKKYGGKGWPILVGIMLLGALITYFFAWTELLHRGFGGIDAAARASRFAVFNIEPNIGVGFERFKLFVPLGVIFGVVGPLPEELIRRPEFIPFFIEGLFILLSPLLVYRYANTKNFKGKIFFLQVYWLCLMPAVVTLMIIHSPFGILNPGSAIRWRTNFETIFYMAPLLLLFQFKDSHQR